MEVGYPLVNTLLTYKLSKIRKINSDEKLLTD